MMKKLISLIIVTITLTTISSLALAQAPTLFQPVYGPPGGKLTLVGNLPSSDWNILLGQVISLVLAITGSLAFAAFTYGGVMMITAEGNDEQIRKGKNIIFWSVLALAIIAASYAIVVGISQLKFFQ
jgi:ABC-type branched-subunit amino acid transport system permease subunit